MEKLIKVVVVVVEPVLGNWVVDVATIVAVGSVNSVFKSCVKVPIAHNERTTVGRVEDGLEGAEVLELLLDWEGRIKVEVDVALVEVVVVVVVVVVVDVVEAAGDDIVVGTVVVGLT